MRMHAAYEKGRLLVRKADSTIEMQIVLTGTLYQVTLYYCWYQPGMSGLGAFPELAESSLEK
jgi:hypothetical protein